MAGFMTSTLTQTTPFKVGGMIDSDAWTVTYVVHSDSSNDCAIIDSVLDYHPKTACTHHTCADKVIN